MKYNLRVLRSTNEEDMDFYQELKTKSLNDDTINIAKEETTFTKDGDYVIALHWIESSVSDEDKDAVREALAELSNPGKEMDGL